MPNIDRYKQESDGAVYIPFDDAQQAFSLKNRPQLSLHASGLVQFSGAGVMSGIDSTGRVKGAAVYSKPFDAPITTGPTCSVVAWGIEKGYQSLPGIKKGLQIYKDSDFVDMSLMDERSNSLHLEFWVLNYNALNRKSMRVREDGTEEFYLRIPFYRNYTLPARIFKLSNPNLALGVLAVLSETQWPKDTPFGFYLSSPRGLLEPDGKELYSLHAFSPPPLFDGFLGKERRLLDY